MKNKKEIVTLIIYFILGGITFGVIGVYAATTLLSQSVYYNNTTSGASSTNVKGALDELYTKANTGINPMNTGTPTNYICNGTNKPTTSSPTTPPSGKNVYIGLYGDGQLGVCIKRNGKEHCFRYNNWITELNHIQEVFSNTSCTIDSDFIDCNASDYRCYFYSSGSVDCHGNSIFGNGSVDNGSGGSGVVSCN